MIGREGPPFLLRITGRIGPNNDNATRWERGLSVYSVEVGEDRVPQPRSVPDIFEFVLRDVRRDPLQDGSAIHKEYSFDLSLRNPGKPLPGAGQIIVPDPWKPGHSLELVYSLGHHSPLHVTPKALAIDLSRPIGQRQARILVADPRGLQDIQVKVMGEETPSPFLVDLPDLKSRPRVAVVAIRVRDDVATAKGIHELSVRSIPAEGSPETVPVQLSVKGG
jgi:hypothetical protein